jgi:hypothetical protein
LANSGDRASAILTISLTGSPAFTKTADTCSGTRLRPRRPTCSVTVQFAPTAPGNATTTLQAISPKGKVRASFGLAGTGVLGFYRVQWAPSSYDFGSSSGAVLFRLLNVGNRPVWLAPGGQLPNSDPFLLVNPGQYQQCLLAHQYGVFGATPLAVGASCDILVQHIAHPCPTVSFVLWTYRYYTNAARTTTDTAPAVATGIGMPCPV